MEKTEKKLSCGPVSTSILAKNKTVEGEAVKFYSVTITNAYKEGEDWKYTNSFDIEDMPKVALVANEAYKYIRLKSKDSNE